MQNGRIEENDVVDADGFILVEGKKKKGEIMEEKQSLKEVEKEIVDADGFILVEGKGKKREILEEKQSTESKKTQGVIETEKNDGAIKMGTKVDTAPHQVSQNEGDNTEELKRRENLKWGKKIQTGQFDKEKDAQMNKILVLNREEVIMDTTHSGSLSNEVGKTEKEKRNSSEQVMETGLNEGEHQDVRNLNSGNSEVVNNGKSEADKIDSREDKLIIAEHILQEEEKMITSSCFEYSLNNTKIMKQDSDRSIPPVLTNQFHNSDLIQKAIGTYGRKVVMKSLAKIILGKESTATMASDFVEIGVGSSEEKISHEALADKDIQVRNRFSPLAVKEVCAANIHEQSKGTTSDLGTKFSETPTSYKSLPTQTSPGSMKQSRARVLKVAEDVNDSVAIAMIQSNVVVIDSVEAGRVRRSSQTMKKQTIEPVKLLPPITTTPYPPFGNGRSNNHSCILQGILVVIPIFLLVCCICKQKMNFTNPNITTLKLAPPAIKKVEVQLAQPFTNKVQVWHIDGPTIEKLLHESASEIPIRYSAQQLRSFTNCYSTKLGHGGFGVVYLGKLLNGMNIAVKLLKPSSSSRVEEQFMAELGTIGTTHHINLVRLYGFCSDEQTTALVYEYMENGSLDKYLFSKTMTIGWEKLFDIAIGSAKGLRYLHQGCHKMIIHYDIKPGNILLDSSFSPKVADFGLAKLCDRENTCVNVTGYRGTRRYSAPELRLKNYPVTHKCDVYSFGMLLFEILGRRKNLNVESVDSFPRRVWVEYEKGRLLEMITEYGIEENYREMARRTFMVALWCVQDSPEARPPMSSVVKMLEGGVEISPPPEPFLYLYSVVANVQKWNRGDFTSSTDSISGSDSSIP